MQDTSNESTSAHSDRQEKMRFIKDENTAEMMLLNPESQSATRGGVGSEEKAGACQPASWAI